MTTEEKAKAYDEALEKAIEIKRKIMSSHLSTESCKAVTEYIDTIIPELNESEDEKIRRTLAEYFGPQAQLDFIRGVPIQKIRDWLEKQKVEHPKEQNQNIELIQKSWYMEGYHVCEFGYEPRWIIKTGEGGPRYEENPKYGQIIEQKPSGWSTEDENMLWNIISIVGESKSFQADEMLDWLKSLRPSWKPSEGPVWRIWENGACGNPDGIPIAIVKAGSTYRLVSCLGAGEEKYIMLSDLEKLPGFEKGEFETAKQDSPWKPSEEQMRALLKVVDKARELHYSSNSEYDEYNVLRSLYEQLKKLM